MSCIFYNCNKTFCDKIFEILYKFLLTWLSEEKWKKFLLGKVGSDP